MSRASRDLPPISAASPASCPALIDTATARIDRSRLRAELRYLTQSCGWQHRDALIRLMQKARLQLKWARQEMADRARETTRKAAHEAALEAQAQATAARHGYDVTALTAQLSRWQLGSLSHSFRAPHERAVYRRAVAIACELASAAYREAAE
jgi:hypothetical protein